MISSFYGRTKPPCKGCPNRYIGCHDKCEEYKGFKKARSEENHLLFMASKNDMMNVPSAEMLKYCRTKQAIERDKRNERIAERHKKEKEKNEL